MTAWKYTVNVADILQPGPGHVSLKIRAELIADRIRASDWYYTELEDALRNLEDAGEDTWSFDEAWDEIYDLADQDRCWIESYVKSDHQNERRQPE
jgi:hypothetical protein